MCLIIYSPKNAPIPRLSLTNGQSSNTDGAGIMWIKGGAVFAAKGFKILAKLVKKLEELEADTAIQCLAVHFRRGTAGGNIPALTHPFVLPGHSAAFMHNGVITNYSERPVGYKGSDTSWFAYNFLAKLPADWMKHEELREKVNKETTGQKMLYFYPGQVHRTGEWTEDGGLWYSNSGYKAWSTSTGYSRTGYSCGGGYGCDYDADDYYKNFNNRVSDNAVTPAHALAPVGDKKTAHKNFEVGDRVWCQEYGTGSVVSMPTEGYPNEFGVRFRGKTWLRYDQDGNRATISPTPEGERIIKITELPMNINYSQEGLHYMAAQKIASALEEVWDVPVTIGTHELTTDVAWWRQAVDEAVKDFHEEEAKKNAKPVNTTA